MFEWWRKWRRTAARRKAKALRTAKKNNRRPYRDNWEDTSRYADPFDGAFWGGVGVLSSGPC